jgi:hypothetical protein
MKTQLKRINNFWKAQMLKFKKNNIKYFIIMLGFMSHISYAENFEDVVSSIQEKIKDYETAIAKDVAENAVEDKKAADELVKENMLKKTKINDLKLANEKLGKEIEEKISKSQSFEKAIAELKEQNKEEIKHEKEREKRKKAIHDTQTVITKQWQENSNEVNQILGTIVDNSVVSNIKCIIEAKVNSEGLISEAMVVRPSIFGLFDGIAQRTVMETGYINLPEGMETAKIIFTKNKAILNFDSEK